MSQIPDDLSDLDELQRQAAFEGWSAGEANALAANAINAEPDTFFASGPSDAQLDATLRQMAKIDYDCKADRKRAFRLIESMRGSVFRVTFRDDGTWTHRLEPRA